MRMRMGKRIHSAKWQAVEQAYTGRFPNDAEHPCLLHVRLPDGTIFALGLSDAEARRIGKELLLHGERHASAVRPASAEAASHLEMVATPDALTRQIRATAQARFEEAVARGEAACSHQREDGLGICGEGPMALEHQPGPHSHSFKPVLPASIA